MPETYQNKRSRIIVSDSGGSLPTATQAHLGKLGYKDNATTVDQAYICIGAATGEPTWREVSTGGTVVRPVKTAAATLTRAESGAFCLFSTAAGYTYTLPDAEAGLWFEFYVGVTITSVAAKVVTASGDFLLGNYIQSTDGTYTSASHLADGSTITSWNGNGSTTGGLVGDWLRVVAISGTQWSVYGMGRATGTEATPFATS